MKLAARAERQPPPAGAGGRRRTAADGGRAGGGRRRARAAEDGGRGRRRAVGGDFGPEQGAGTRCRDLGQVMSCPRPRLGVRTAGRASSRPLHARRNARSGPDPCRQTAPPEGGADIRTRAGFLFVYEGRTPRAEALSEPLWRLGGCPTLAVSTPLLRGSGGSDLRHSPTPPSAHRRPGSERDRGRTALLGEYASTADIEPGPWPNRCRPQQRSTLCTRSVPGGPAPYGSGAQSDRPSQPRGVARRGCRAG